jgi:ribosomal protein S1
VVRLTEFGAFVELEPGIEGLAHVSTFAPTGHSKGWARSVTVGMTAAFEVLSIDPVKKRIGLKLVDEGSTRASGAAPSQAVTDAREADEVREYNERADELPAEAFGSLADKLRGALKPREK